MTGHHRCDLKGERTHHTKIKCVCIVCYIYICRSIHIYISPYIDIYHMPLPIHSAAFMHMLWSCLDMQITNIITTYTILSVKSQRSFPLSVVSETSCDETSSSKGEDLRHKHMKLCNFCMLSLDTTWIPSGDHDWITVTSGSVIRYAR